jgi:hypothetical protein
MLNAAYLKKGFVIKYVVVTSEDGMMQIENIKSA